MTLPTTAAACAVLAALVSTTFSVGRAAGLPPTASASTDPAGLVHPLDGTGTGPVDPGTVGEFPGADTPFGMIQWSPDTSPDAVQSGGGYAYTDSEIDGFSLTHLSGTGCPSYQDVPILPTVGPIGGSPSTALASFTHHNEQASPGRYQVQLGPAPIEVALAVTTRSGISRFVFPPSRQSNVLFKVADGSNPVSASDVRVIGRDEVEGAVTSGQFCGTGTDYTLHFVADFNRPFTAAGTWSGAGTAATPSCSGSSCGAFATFDTTADRQVLMKVGVSFVSVARRSPEPEGRGSGLVAHARRRPGPGALERPPRTDRRRRWHAGRAAHVLHGAVPLAPVPQRRLRRERGLCRKRRQGAPRPRRDEYANFSEWDIYRSEVQLEALLAPGTVGAMVQSLVDDAEQGGWLPKWAIVGGDASQMDGDSADPIIADAYAMGARDFDVKTALRYMEKGATEQESGHGFQIERQYLSQYLSQHYVNAGSLDLTSIDYSIGGSATLEYALDDFAIAQIAAAEHEGSEATTMAQRAANWEYLFNPATGYIQARGPDGAFPPGQAFEPSQLEPGGQTGFEEGNAVQYTWAVPQDLAALASLMGGDAAATGELEMYFDQLNATRDAPYDWSGNEPSEWAPWLFDYFGAPAETQRAVRAIVDTEYADGPVDEPGNDDLGALSSWYVWGAVGLFPVTPGEANLALASPLFPTVVITLPDGHRLVEHAPAAAPSRPFVHALHVTGIDQPATGPTAACGRQPSAASSGTNWEQPWLPASALRSGGTLRYALASTPDATWAATADASPPSYGTGALPAVGFSLPSGSVSLTEGQPAAVQLGVAPANDAAGQVAWHVSSIPPGMQVTPTSGTLTLTRATPKGGSGGGCTPQPVRQTLHVTGQAAGSAVLRVDLRTAGGVALPPVVLDVVTTG